MKDQPAVSPEVAVIPFSYESNEIRVVKDENGNPWWVAKDVCETLCIKNHNDAVKSLDDDERGVAKIYPPHMQQGQVVITISESGLYTLIIRSNKPEAKKFRKWVTSEVLPQIRKTGSYQLAEEGQLKRCSGCNHEKPLSCFHRDPGKRDGYSYICKECGNERARLRYQAKRQITGGPALAPVTREVKDWQTTWDVLCDAHSDLSVAVEKLRKDVTDLLPADHFQPIPKGVDVLEHIRLHYSAMEKMARQINVLSEILMWRSPKVMNGNIELGKPRY